MVKPFQQGTRSPAPPACNDTVSGAHTKLEESIARIAPSDHLEGEIARLGAVTAALSADEPLRALQLATQFLTENPAPEIAQKFHQLMQQAEEMLDRAAADEPIVKPVTFTLRAA